MANTKTQEQLDADIALHEAWVANPANGARMDYTDQVIQGLDLAGHNLTSAILVRCSMTSATAAGTIFTSADLSQASANSMDLTGCVFASATLATTDFSASTLIGADFGGCTLAKLSGNTPCTFNLADLTDADMSTTNHTAATAFTYCDLTRCNFTGATLDTTSAEVMFDANTVFVDTIFTDAHVANNGGGYVVTMTRCILDGADFSGGDMDSWVFSYCSLDGTNMSSCTLTSADFSWSLLKTVNFTSADLTGAIFSFAIIDGCTWTTATLTGINLQSARYDLKTMLTALGY